MNKESAKVKIVSLLTLFECIRLLDFSEITTFIRSKCGCLYFVILPGPLWRIKVIVFRQAASTTRITANIVDIGSYLSAYR